MTDLTNLLITAGCAAVHPDQRGGQHVGVCAGIRIMHEMRGALGLAVAIEERVSHG